MPKKEAGKVGHIYYILLIPQYLLHPSWFLSDYIDSSSANGEVVIFLNKDWSMLLGDLDKFALSNIHCHWKMYVLCLKRWSTLHFCLFTWTFYLKCRAEQAQGGTICVDFSFCETYYKFVYFFQLRKICILSFRRAVELCLLLPVSK